MVNFLKLSAGRQNERKKARTPDLTAMLSKNLGVAIWSEHDGAFDIKIGDAFTVTRDGEEKLIVKTTISLCNFNEVVSVLASVSRTFATETSLDVPVALRDELLIIAERLELASLSKDEELNGLAKLRAV